jgi:hypothetical protein
MTYLVIGLCMAAGLAAWVLRRYRRFVEDARMVNERIQENAAKARARAFVRDLGYRDDGARRES